MRRTLSPAPSTAANRIDRLFAEPRRGAALILYITAGHPDIATSLTLAPVVANIADIIEVGIPFSDPVADGPIIQASTQVALSHGTRIEHCFQVVSAIRRVSDRPVVFLTYYNPVLRYGLERFASECGTAEVDGVICADLPPEESTPLYEALEAGAVHLIPMVAPTSTDERLSRAARSAGGFVYCVSRTGVTGIRDELNTDLSAFLSRVRRFSPLPRAVGFGVSTPQQARDVARLCEGVIIGSALVNLISKTPKDGLEASIRNFGAMIRVGMDTA